MIRAAAKNHSHVAVVVDPSDYDDLLQHLAGDVSSKEAVQYRKHLAWKAFQHCATYDSTVAEWLWSQIGAALQALRNNHSGNLCIVSIACLLLHRVWVCVILHAVSCVCLLCGQCFMCAANFPTKTT